MFLKNKRRAFMAIEMEKSPEKIRLIKLKKKKQQKNRGIGTAEIEPTNSFFYVIRAR